jgi:hypothetical protein
MGSLFSGFLQLLLAPLGLARRTAVARLPRTTAVRNDAAHNYRRH